MGFMAEDHQILSSEATLPDLFIPTVHSFLDSQSSVDHRTNEKKICFVLAQCKRIDDMTSPVIHLLHGPWENSSGKCSFQRFWMHSLQLFLTTVSALLCSQLNLSELCISVMHENIMCLLVRMGQRFKDLMFGAVSDLLTQKLGTGSRERAWAHLFLLQVLQRE